MRCGGGSGARCGEDDRDHRESFGSALSSAFKKAQAKLNLNVSNKKKSKKQNTSKFH